jgi:predicted HicB family RNase H-like nuclease
VSVSFRNAVDDYLATCEKHGKPADEPFKGSFNVRVGPELHKRAAVFAAERKKKLNSVVTEALEKYLASA